MQTKAELLPNLGHEVVNGITGFKLCSYLVALEGWRRGLVLKWYKDETELCKLDRLNSSTHGKFFSLSSNKSTHYFFRSRGDKISNNAVRICQDKEKTKDMLSKNGVSVPKGAVLPVDDEERIISFATDIGFPVILKPVKGSMGKGVYTNLRNEKSLMDALNDFRSKYAYSEILIEKHHLGKEYRIYVVGDKVVGATNRIPANVTGDGRHDIQTLIEKKNKERKTNPYLSPKPIKIDYEIQNSLKSKGYDVDSVPPEGETISMREKSNLSSGGDPIEATDEISKNVKQLAVDTLKALPSIPHAGVDVIVDPDASDKGVVLEVNATAEIGFHLFPLEGKARDVTKAIIDFYFPETVNASRTPLYFDYLSTLEPLKKWSTEEIKVMQPPMGGLYGKKYIATGKVQRVGYMNRIRRQALRKNLMGFAQKKGRDKVEVSVFSKDEESVEKFMEDCKTGSKKSKVKHVEKEILPMDKPYKVGFEILTD